MASLAARTSSTSVVSSQRYSALHSFSARASTFTTRFALPCRATTVPAYARAVTMQVAAAPVKQKKLDFVTKVFTKEKITLAGHDE